MKYTITYLDPTTNQVKTTTTSDIISSSLATVKLKREGYVVTSIEPIKI